MARRTLSRLAFGGLAAICCFHPAWSSAQAADARTAYIERGHQTEARQHAYHERMDRLHDAIAEELREAAPDLLPKQDLGRDGFQVLELVANQTGIMSSISAGSVTAAHFEGLTAAKGIQLEMQAGLTALYQTQNPVKAVTHFQAVLARNPDHFGATFQLARALDEADKPAEALIVWRNILAMAEAVHNTETAATAKARLALPR